MPTSAPIITLALVMLSALSSHAASTGAERSDRVRRDDEKVLNEAIKKTWSSSSSGDTVKQAFKISGTNSSQILQTTAGPRGATLSLTQHLVNINSDARTQIDMDSFKTLRFQIRKNRMEKKMPRRSGSECFMFSAPHAIALERDGDDKTHKPEEHTAEIVEAFSDALEGGYVTWSKDERYRINKVGFQGKGSSRSKMDPSNRDPNYQTDAERKTSPWAAALREARGKCGRGSSQHPTDRGLHVDVHGMSNMHGVDLIVGTGAMERVAKAAGDWKALQRVANLEMNLYAELAPVLKKVENRVDTTYHPRMKKQKLFFNEHYNMSKRTMEKQFSGGSPRSFKGVKYNTMTMVATDRAVFRAERYGRKQPFAMSVQMEMSENLRAQLAKKKTLARDFARAIRKAYRKTARCDGLAGSETKLCNLVPGARIWKPKDARAVYDKLIAAGFSNPRKIVRTGRLAMNAELEARGFSQGFGRDSYAALQNYIKVKLPGTSRRLRGSRPAQLARQ